MDWSNIIDIFRMENLVYWLVTIIVIILTTIKQFNKQAKSNQNVSQEILKKLQKLDEQNLKILKLLKMHSDDIGNLKESVNELENRVDKLEDSQIKLYKRIGEKAHELS